MDNTLTVFRVQDVDSCLLAAFARLMPQLSATLPVPGEAALCRIVASPSTALFCARYGEPIAGVLSLAWYDVPSGRCAWIEDVVVDAQYRGRGIGRRLVQSALEYAGQIGADKVSLTSHASRAAAQALYLNLGFERYDTTLFRIRKGK